MKIIAIMGEPGTGKTELLKKLVNLAEMTFVGSVQLVPFYQKDSLYVLGRYDGEGYAQGTDRMSMACQPEVIKWLATLPKEATVLFEGDRLTNQSFLEHCNDKYELYVFYLSASEIEKERRYASRGSEQSATFLKGRATKYSNILGNFTLMDVITRLRNETIADQAAVIEAVNAVL